MILVHQVIWIYIWVLIVAALLSWFPASSSGGLATAQRVLRVLTEPVLRPLRALLPRPSVGGVGIDLSVLVAIVLLTIVNNII